MSDRADQRTASCSYSKGWRLFSVIILRPGLRLLMKHQWQGKENFPRTGGVILAPNHLSYADWPTVALFTGSHRKRYPVFMIKSAIFEVKVLGPLMRKLGQLPVYRGRGDAGLVLKQAEQALQTRGRRGDESDRRGRSIMRTGARAGPTAPRRDADHRGRRGGHARRTARRPSRVDASVTFSQARVVRPLMRVPRSVGMISWK